jgi:hypothetical protein
VVLASVKAAEGVGWPDALPLLPHPAELIIGLIAFAILYWIYATKVVPKMEAMYEERAAAIEGGMQQAEEAQAEARAALEKYNAQLAGARTEANEIRDGGVPCRPGRSQGCNVEEVGNPASPGCVSSSALTSPSNRSRRIRR